MSITKLFAQRSHTSSTSVTNMSFRRYAPQTTSPASPVTPRAAQQLPSGVKPASIPTISTGTSTLDSLLSPAAGLPVSSCLLIEEDGTGNYSGVVLRQYVAEGVVQGDRIWVGGIGESWWRGVPALSKEDSSKQKAVKSSTRGETGDVEEKMRIAWRYGINDKPQSSSTDASTMTGTFCHSFDISQQMSLPHGNQLVFSPPPSKSANPYQSLLTSLLSFLDSVPITSPTRLVLPDLQNPLLYPPESTNPSYVLQFLHTVIALLHSRPYCTLIISLSSSFFPRSRTLTCWLEHLSTHVIQLCPFPHSVQETAKSSSTAKQKPQGLVKVHKGGLMDREMAYRVGRHGMVLEEWSLPPLEEEAPRVKQGFVIDKEVGNVEGKSATKSLVSGISKKDLEF